MRGLVLAMDAIIRDPVRVTRLLPLVFAGLFLLSAWVADSAEDDLAAAVVAVAERHGDVARVEPQALATMTDALVVDVRTSAEWDASHLRSARHISQLAELVALATAHPRQTLVLYCSIGERSSRLAAALRTRLPNVLVADLRGGIFTWATLGLPLVDGTGQSTNRVHPYDDRWGRLLPDHSRTDRP